MQNVSIDFLTAVEQPGGRKFNSKVIVKRTGYADITYDDTRIVSIKRTGASVSGQAFSVGDTVSSTFSVTLKNIDGALDGLEYRDSILIPAIGILLPNGSVEYCPLGQYYVDNDNIERGDGSVILPSYDGMIKLTDLYISDLTYPATLLQIAQEIASKAGLALAATDFPNAALSVAQKPDLGGTTLRQALGWVAEAACSFAQIDRSGNIAFVWYSGRGIEIDTHGYFTLKHADASIPAYDGVELMAADTDMNNPTLGTSSNPLKIVANPLLTWYDDNNTAHYNSAAMTAIYNKINGFTFMPFECNWQGNPALNPGDAVLLTDTKGVTYSSYVMDDELDYTGGLSATTQAYGLDASQSSTSGGLSAQVDKVTTEQQKFENLTATNFSSVNSSIENLSVEKLSAADAVLQYATVQELNVANENVQNLTDVNAIIVNLLSDKGTIQDLTSDTITANFASLVHGTIGYAQIAHVNADMIDTGKLNTALLTILGSDGRFKISDNTMQIFDGIDAQHLFERIAIGRIPVLDDSGNSITVNGEVAYTYGFRVRSSDGKTVLYDQNGITKEGITSGWDALNNNSMDGKKLDIQTVVTAINNGTTTIDSSKVMVDKKTLDVALSEKISPADISGFTRNLLLNTDFSNDVTSWTSSVSDFSIVSDTTYAQCAKIISTDKVSGIYQSPTVPFTAGQKYSVSIMLKADSAMSIYVAIDGTATDNAQSVSVTTDWLLYTFAFTYTGKSPNVRFYGQGTFYVVRIKLEQGIIATGWSPAPEDVSQKFTEQQAEITSNAQGITTKVKQSTYASDITKANSDISDLQTALTNTNSDVSNAKSLVSDLQGQVNDKASKSDLQTATETLAQSITTLQQTSDSVSATISKMYQGGTNRIKNSAGLNGVGQGTGLLVTGTVMIDTINDGSVVSGKNFRLSGNSELNSESPISVSPKVSYTMTVLVKKDTANNASKVLLIDGSNTIEVVNTQDVFTDFWKRYSFTFTPAGQTLTLKVTNIAGQFWVADMMLAAGPIPSNWTPAFNELYADVVKIDTTGITVSNSADNSGLSTHVSPTDFSIAHQGQVVVKVSADTTQLQSANILNTLQVANVQCIPRPDGSGYLDIAYLN